MKIILNVATHGNERIGFAVVRELKKCGLLEHFSVQIGNDLAAKKRRRFIDQDLNRSFPGKRGGNYEERRAYELGPAIRSADMVIDLHSTTSGLRDALIVTKLDKKTKACVMMIRPKYLLVMDCTKHNALISSAKVGVGFEYGDDSRTTAKRITVSLKRLLAGLRILKRVMPARHGRTVCFRVFGKTEKPKGYILAKGIVNYRLVRKGQIIAMRGSEKLRAKRNFYPVLFGEKNYEDYFGFTAERVALS
jgi:succinylglutamate desuccinylase